jgi:hypothetical protein
MDPDAPATIRARLTSLLAGTWIGREERAGTAWAPGGTAEATWLFAPAAGGAALVADYASEQDGRPSLAGHGVLSVDPDSGDVLWHWFDSVGHPPREPGDGTFDGEDALVLSRTSPRGTNLTTLRRAGDGLEQVVAFAAPGEPMTELVRGRYVQRARRG